MTFFEIGWSLLLIKNTLQIANYVNIPERLDMVVEVAVLLFFLASIYSKKYTKKQVYIYISLALLALYSGWITGLMQVPTSVLTTIAVKGENIRDVLKKTYRLKGLLLAITIITSFVMWVLELGDGCLYYYMETQERLRICLGYGMAGHLADCILDLSIIWLLIHYNQLRDIHYVHLFGTAIMTYMLTDSRVVLLAMLFIIMSVMVSKKNKALDKIWKLGAKVCVPLFLVGMILVISLYERGCKIGYIADRVLNSRVRMCGFNLDVYGGTLLGQKCIHHLDDTYHDYVYKWLTYGVTFDNAYIYLLVNIGAIWLVMMAAGFYITACRSEAIVSVILISISIGAMIDVDFLNTARSIPLLLVGWYVGKALEGTNDLQRSIPVFCK